MATRSWNMTSCNVNSGDTTVYVVTQRKATQPALLSNNECFTPSHSSYVFQQHSDQGLAMTQDHSACNATAQLRTTMMVHMSSPRAAFLHLAEKETHSGRGVGIDWLLEWGALLMMIALSSVQAPAALSSGTST